jgi:hypothetical protein
LLTIYAAWAGIPLEDFPKLKEWVIFCYEREGFKKGANLPARKPEEGPQLSEEEIAKKAREWIMRGMKDDAVKKDSE